MIHTAFRLTCDRCNRRGFDQGDESEDDVYANAQMHGWTFQKVQNGSIWDFCPECTIIYKNEKTT